MQKIHHPSINEQLFFLLFGAFISSPLPSFYQTAMRRLEMIGWGRIEINFFVSVLMAPFFEEFVKAFPLFYRHGETEKSLFKLGFLTGLGFGIVEFFIYVLINNAPVLDRLPGLLFHATNTSIVAYGISRKDPSRFYIIAVFLHLLNNLTANLGNIWYFFGIFAITTSYILSYYLSKKVSDRVVEDFV